MFELKRKQLQYINRWTQVLVSITCPWRKANLALENAATQLTKSLWTQNWPEWEKKTAQTAVDKGGNWKEKKDFSKEKTEYKKCIKWIEDENAWLLLRNNWLLLRP